MSTTIFKNVVINNALQNADAVYLESEDDTYGVRISPDGDIVVASSTAMENYATGRYRYTFTDPSPGLTYAYSIKVVITTPPPSMTLYEAGTIQSGAQPTEYETDYFTSEAEVRRLFGSEAVDFRWDDDPTNPLVMLDAIADAHDIVRQYLWLNYENADLLVTNWVRRRATWIAAFLFSQRRGNPAQYMQQFERIILELQAVFNRQLWIPGLAPKTTGGPALSNYTIDNRGLAPVQKVLARYSLGTYPGQEIAGSSLSPIELY